ncbi:MAG: glycosyltransferase family 39 protein [Planctomycetota bacterium]
MRGEAAAPASPLGGSAEERAAENRRFRRAALAIVVLALLLRLGAALFLGDVLGYHQRVRSGDLQWDWGYEQASIAQAFARGEGLADPFNQGTGATAWAAPAYPVLLGGLIRAFGGITVEVAWILFGIQVLAASLTCYALWRLGRDLYSQWAGLAAALLWAGHPMAVYLPIALVWDSTLVALTMTWFLAAMLERGRCAPYGAVAKLGVLLGLTLLVNPAPLALVPMLCVYYLRRRGSGLRLQPRGVQRLAILLGTAALIVSPWAVRNAVVLGTPQIRSNLGVEVFVGNNDGAIGLFNGRIHPAYNEAEMQRYRELDEVAYSKDSLERGLDWIEQNPERFGWLTLERFKRFWFGPDPRDEIVLGTGFVQRRDAMGWIKWGTHALMGLLAITSMIVWRGRPGSRTVMRGALFLFPLVYYVTHVFERYRFPIEPLVTLAAAVLLLRLIFGPKSRFAARELDAPTLPSG